MHLMHSSRADSLRAFIIDIRPRITLSNDLARGVDRFIATLAVAGLMCLTTVLSLPVFLQL
jgi:hypothetical protein